MDESIRDLYVNEIKNQDVILVTKRNINFRHNKNKSKLNLNREKLKKMYFKFEKLAEKYKNAKKKNSSKFFENDKINLIQTLDNSFDNSVVKNDEYEYFVMCPECKTVTKTDDKYYRMTECPHCHADYKKYAMEKVGGDYELNYKNSDISGFKIIHKKDKIVLIITFITYGCVIWTPTPTFYHKTISIAFVYNLKTGRTTLLPAEGKKNEHINFIYSNIVNSTFGINKTIYSYCLPLEEKIGSYLLDAFRKRGYFTDRTDIDTKTFFKNSPLYNRFKMFTNDQISGLEKESYILKTGILRNITPDMSAKEAFDIILAKSKFKGKSTRKAIVNNILTIYYLKLFSRSGFKKIDFFNRFHDGLSSHLSTLLSNNRTTDNTTVSFAVSFIKEIIKCYDEKKALSIIDDCYFIDTAIMYKKAILLNDNDVPFSLNNWPSSMTLHDFIDSYLKKIEFKNIHLNYTNNQMTLNRNYNNLTFKLADDTDELIDVGNKMKICVGNAYREKAVCKNCLIVLVYDDKRSPVTCIEINPSGNVLVQVKGPCNQVPSEKVIPSIIKWIEDSKLKTENCKDYKLCLETYKAAISA